MKDILNESDLVKMDTIKETIQRKDIRTHSQLKVELKKVGLTMDIKKDGMGKQQSYSITDKDKNGKESLKMNSEIGKDRAVMKEFDDLIKDNRDKAIENKEPKTDKEKGHNSIMEKAKEMREANAEQNKGKGNLTTEKGM